MFGNTLAEEYRLLAGRLGFSAEAIRQLIVNGIRASWLSEARKRTLEAEFAADPAWSTNRARKRKPNNRRPRGALKMRKVNLAEKLSRFKDHWNPRIVGELNGQHVKLVKFSGPFVWHKHDDEDELFLVIRGSFRMEFRDRSVQLDEGEFLIVPRGVEHRPVADEEVCVLLFEPASTKNTGDADSELTVDEPEWI